MSKKTIKKPIEEISGLNTIRKKPGVQQSTSSTSTSRTTNYKKHQHFGREIRGIQMDFCHNMSGWQSEAVQKLLQGRDVYVSTYPASGKTMPVVCYWGEKILELNPRLSSANDPKTLKNLVFNIDNILNNPEKIGKLIFFCPVRALVTDVSKEFRERLFEIFQQVLDFSINNPRHPQSNIILNSFLKGTNLDRQYRSEYEKINIINRDISRLERRDDFERNREVINYTRNLINQRKNIIDNMSQKIGKALQYKLKQLVATRSHVHKDGNPANAIVTVAVIGSATTVFRQLGNQINNTKLVVFDEAHLLQKIESEGGDPTENIKNMYYILRELRTYNRNCRVAFLSGTVHPEAADDLIEYMKKCFNRNFSRVFSEQAKNKAHIDVIADDRISDNQYQLKMLTNPEGRNNLLIMFSKARILDLVREAVKKSGSKSPSAVDRGDYIKGGPTKYQDYTSELKPNDDSYKLSTKEIKSQALAMPGAEEIYEPLQRQAVSSGFGFIIRPDNREDIDQNKLNRYLKDSEIVADLFKKGKIHTLISTHAVGIGVNIYVKKLYIPTIMSPTTGGKLEKMGTAVSSQLYNRVGRAAFPIGSVITSSRYVDDVITALSAGQSEFERGVNVDVGKLDCKAFNVFQALCYAASQYHRKYLKDQFAKF